MTRIATRGLRTTVTVVVPIEARRPTSCGRSTRPAGRTVRPFATSSPTRPTFRPGVTASRASTRRPPASNSALSATRTASAPWGRGAPVMIRTASPGPTIPANGRAGYASPTSERGRGFNASAPNVSAPRTAKPSMAARANDGTFTGETTSPANTRPAATNKATGSPESGATRLSSRLRTSETSARSRKPLHANVVERLGSAHGAAIRITGNLSPASRTPHIGVIVTGAREPNESWNFRSSPKLLARNLTIELYVRRAPAPPQALPRWNRAGASPLEPIITSRSDNHVDSPTSSGRHRGRHSIAGLRMRMSALLRQLLRQLRAPPAACCPNPGLGNLPPPGP